MLSDVLFPLPRQRCQIPEGITGEVNIANRFCRVSVAEWLRQPSFSITKGIQSKLHFGVSFWVPCYRWHLYIALSAADSNAWQELVELIVCQHYVFGYVLLSVAAKLNPFYLELNSAFIPFSSNLEFIVTHAGCIAARMGIAFSRVCLFVHTLKRKTAWAIDTKLCTCILYSSGSACIDPEVKRWKVKVTRLQKPSRSHGC